MTDQSDPLDAATVAELAQLLGYAPLDAATVARVGAGAAQAVAALRATATRPLLDTEPCSFLSELERQAP